MAIKKADSVDSGSLHPLLVRSDGDKIAAALAHAGSRNRLPGGIGHTSRRTTAACAGANRPEAAQTSKTSAGLYSRCNTDAADRRFPRIR